MNPTNTEKSSSSTSSSIPFDEKKEWIDLLNESVHTSDDIDIGDIYAVSRNFVVVMRGLINVHYYYIPINKVEGWDGNVLWLKVSENEVKEKYERNKIPDPRRYYIKDYTYYTDVSNNYFLLPVIPPRYLIPPKYPEDEANTKFPSSNNLSLIYICDLCNKTFNSQDELDKHIENIAH